jgi:hypothetical protein
VQAVEMTLVSMVTAAFSARARPHGMIAPVSRVMLWAARMLPSNDVLVPRVAELPTCQNKPSSGPPLITWTTELLAVVKLFPISKTHNALSLPCALSVSVPVS